MQDDSFEVRRVEEREGSLKKEKKKKSRNTGEALCLGRRKTRFKHSDGVE